MKTYVYKRKNDDLSEIEKRDCPCELYIASDRACSAFRRLKQAIEQERGVLIVSSMYALADDKNAILKELLWLQDRHISTVFADLPVTWIFDNSEASEVVLNVLIDIYKDLLANPTFELPTATGRKKIGFPANWDSLYNEWKKGNITSKDFIEKSGLTKGTLYKMLKEYNAEMH